MDHVEQFLAEMSGALESGSLRRLTLGKYRGKLAGLKQIQVRPVDTKDGTRLSARLRYATRDVTENVDDLVPRFRDWLADGFRSAHLHTATEDLQLEFSKRGKTRLHRSRPTVTREIAGHDREKQRMVPLDRPYLHALGITSTEGKVLPSRNDKWKQINRFIEVFEAAFRNSPLAEEKELRVLDFGSGKGYLTFALHDFLRERVGDRVSTIGVELREGLAKDGNDLATRSGCEGLRFESGDIAGFPAGRIDIVVALHACDTATDLALHQGVRNGAKLILSAPCCHQEIRPQIRIPNVLEPMLRHGVHLGTEADTITDSLRALLLEASGYRVKVFEFISLEHTSKNKMIVATKDDGIDAERAVEEFRRLRDFYGIQRQKMAELLGVI